MLLPELTSIHDRYLLLSRVIEERFGGSAGGKLLLCRGFGPCGIADSVGASVAGVVTLCVAGDPELLRAGLRGGFCDFVVAHLDEALRILKNELRRKLPVCVGLGAAPEACIAEMIERGVQPHLLAGGDDGDLRIFVERGAVRLAEAGKPDPDTSLFCWRVDGEAVRLMPRIAQLAGMALEEDRMDTGARRRWLERAPRYLGRNFAGGQCLRMTEAEAGAFTTQVRREMPAALIERAEAAA